MHGVQCAEHRDSIRSGAGACRGTRHGLCARDFLRQFGAVIAICLGLALLAHALVMIVGTY